MVLHQTSDGSLLQRIVQLQRVFAIEGSPSHMLSTRTIRKLLGSLTSCVYVHLCALVHRFKHSIVLFYKVPRVVSRLRFAAVNSQYGVHCGHHWRDGRCPEPLAQPPDVR